ncbi:terminase large subunit [Roseobacter phage CRP-212]|nr:terminase large subunit [Roseobacter phage CRP-212]
MDWEQKTRPNANAKIPYAYKASEDDPLILIPDPIIIQVLEQAFTYLENEHSLRETANWVSEQTGKKLSHQGLSNIWRQKTGGKSQRQKTLDKQHRKRKPKTYAEKEEAKIRRKIADAKRVRTMAEKKLKARQKPEEGLVQPFEGVTEGLDFEAAPQEREVIFKPNPGPQTEFLAASEREVLYGGAAGGGKSAGLLADPLRYFANPNFNGLLLRRTNDELRELVWASQELYPKAYPGAKWAEKKSQWTFPSGARLWMTYLERPEDVLRYQGQAFSWIGFDELTQHPTPFAWDYMRSRLRTTDPDLPIFMRATTNPGGPGHQWVKKMFIDPAPPNHKFVAKDPESGEDLVYPETHDKAGEPLFFRRFIPASLYDNPYLTDDGSYEANLLSLPENQRRQLLEGDWAIADGAAFPEFRQAVHVCEPFHIPDDWRRFRSCDYGYSSHSAVHWFAIDPSYETLYCYRELYVSKHTGRDLAKAILSAEQGDKIQYGILDSSCWHNRGQIGPSIAEEMIAEGCRWRPSDRSAGARIAGKNRFHELLKVNEDTELPGIIFFNHCRQIISDLPVIPSDPKGTDDIDPRYASDHAYDSVRYGIMSRPRAFSPFDFSDKPINKWQPSDSVFGY